MNDSLTDQERAVLDHLAAAWNEFVKLPKQHPMHGTEMAQAIHACQRLIMARVVERQEGWVKDG